MVLAIAVRAATKAALLVRPVSEIAMVQPPERIAVEAAAERRHSKDRY
jgi:hypothetical protein